MAVFERKRRLPARRSDLENFFRLAVLTRAAARLDFSFLAYSEESTRTEVV